MKKAISLAVAILLVFSCITTAFAAQTATPDEATKVKSLTLTKLPDKLNYSYPDDLTVYINGEYAGDLNTMAEKLLLMDSAALEDYDEDMTDKLKSYEISLNINMDGAEITAEYSDGTKSHVDVKDCEVKVKDPVKGSELLEVMQKFENKMQSLEDTDPDSDDWHEIMKELESVQEEMTNLVFRDYTVAVSYGGQTAEFTVKLDMPNVPDFPYAGANNYEVVAVKETKPKTYYLTRDFEVEEYDDGTKEYFLNFDTSDITVVVRNKETGEKFEYTGDNIELYYSYFSDEEAPKSGKYTALGSVFDHEKGCYVEFDYEFELVNDLNKELPESENTDKASTKDEATVDQADSNGAIQTGDTFVVVVPLLIVIFSVAVVYAYYRKKVTK